MTKLLVQMVTLLQILNHRLHLLLLEMDHSLLTHGIALLLRTLLLRLQKKIIVLALLMNSSRRQLCRNVQRLTSNLITIVPVLLFLPHKHISKHLFLLRLHLNILLCTGNKSRCCFFFSVYCFFMFYT